MKDDKQQQQTKTLSGNQNADFDMTVSLVKDIRDAVHSHQSSVWVLSLEQKRFSFIHVIVENGPFSASISLFLSPNFGKQ